MFYCNDCADINNWPKTVGNSLGICECCRKKAVCNCMSSAVLPDPVGKFYCESCRIANKFPKMTWRIENRKCDYCGFLAAICYDSSSIPILKPNDMYQGRREDFDPKIDQILEEGPKINDAMESIEGDLKKFYHIKENGIGSVRIFCLGSRTAEYIYEEAFPKDWDYTKEMVESLNKLNESVLDAYITFLECEREALIKRWNDMAKELKPEKK